jgi:cellulose synthase/poly-beta-1,6-N-acetylglucosamine synthase-like glycosyltransferase
MALEALGASAEDIVLIADTDEIPHPHAIETLRTRLSTDSDAGDQCPSLCICAAFEA